MYWITLLQHGERILNFFCIYPPKINPIVRKTRRPTASGFGGKAGLSDAKKHRPCFTPTYSRFFNRLVLLFYLTLLHVVPKYFRNHWQYAFGEIK